MEDGKLLVQAKIQEILISPQETDGQSRGRQEDEG